VDCERLHLFDNQEGGSLTQPDGGASASTGAPEKAGAEAAGASTAEPAGAG
jgi:hypothetical protein